MNGPYQYWGCSVGTNDSSIQCQTFDASLLWKVKNSKEIRGSLSHTTGLVNKKKVVFFCVTPHELSVFI